MKRNKIVIGAVSVLLTALLMFTACSDIINPPEAVDSGDSTGTLLVRMGEAGRTLAPKGEELDGLTYKLMIYKGDYENPSEIAFEGDFDSEETYTLAAGDDWNISAGAFNSADQLVAGGQALNVIVQAGKTAQANLTLIPVPDQDFPGTFTYNISFPDEDTIESITGSATLTPRNEVPLYVGNNESFSIDMSMSSRTAAGGMFTVAGTQDLPAGMYTLTLKLTSDRIIGDDNKLEVNRMEVVYIYPHMTTDATFVFTDADFTADIVLSGTAAVTGSDDYIPSQVNLFNDDYEIVHSAPITFNAEDDKYEWEISLPSTEVEDNLTAVTLNFDAHHKADNTKVVHSGPYTTPSDALQHWGLDNIALSGAIGTFRKAETFVLPEGAVVTIQNADVMRGGYTDIEVTNPPKSGLVGSAVELYGNYTGAYNGLYNAKASEDGTKIIASVYMAPNNTAFTLRSSSFFSLKGTVYVNNSTDIYKPVKIEAFEPGETEDDEPILIGSTEAFTGVNNSWEIEVPRTYVWRNSDTDVILKTTSTVSGKPDWIQETKHNISSPYDKDVTVTPFRVMAISANRFSPDTIRITWTEADWATKYDVYKVGTPDTKIGTINAGMTSYDYVTTAGYNNFYVVGFKADGTAGYDSPTTGDVWVKQPAPANFKAERDISTGLLTSVKLTWDAVPNGYRYIINRYDDISESTTQVYSGYYYLGTTYTDSFLAAPAVNVNITYYIEVTDPYYGTAATSDRSSVSISAPVAAALNLDQLRRNETLAAGEKKVYMISDITSSPVSIYGWDSTQKYPTDGTESLDVKFTRYIYNQYHNLQNSTPYDSANGDSVSVPYYGTLVVVVEAATPGATGTYSLRVDN